MEKDFDGDFDGLHIPVGSFTPYFIFSGLHIINNCILDDRDLKVVAFAVSDWGKAKKSIEFNGVMPDFNLG